MKANKNTVLIGEKVILVPYQCNHIPVHKLESTDCHHDWKSGYLLQKCHTWISWMLNKEPRQLTVSELLTLKEEYDMQCMCVLYYKQMNVKWQLDKDKLTFIILLVST